MQLQKPVLIVIAGPNGSGKTSVTIKILKHEWVENCVYINPDNIAKDTFGDWNSTDAIMKAANLSAQMREACIAENKSLIFETVLSAADKVDFIKRAKAKDCFIRLFFVGIQSPAINASRIAQRVMEGGHDVPIPQIISRYSKYIANFNIISAIADKAYSYDNSIDFEDPQLLFRVVDGKILKEYTLVNNWAMPVLFSLKQLSDKIII